MKTTTHKHSSTTCTCCAPNACSNVGKPCNCSMGSAFYQPKTGARCSCKQGIQRDNCPNCEGTGWVIDFRLIRERNKA